MVLLILLVIGLLLLPFHLFLPAAGAAGILCRAEEAASPHADDLQLHLLRVGEPVVLPADAVQYEVDYTNGRLVRRIRRGRSCSSR